MKRCALLVLAVFFLGLGSLFADNAPPDPIIDIERGTGTIGFNGTATFTITDNSTSCVASDMQGIDSCSAQTPDFGNLTGQDITSLEFDFLTGPIQGVFSAGPNSPFQTVDTVIPGVEAIYSGGVITHNCTETVGVEGAPDVVCDPDVEIGPKPSEFTVGFGQVFVAHGGSVDIRISSSPTSSVPEPPAAALMLTGAGVFGVVRRWFWKA